MPEAQENLAVMYVEWRGREARQRARLCVGGHCAGHGGGEAAKGIVAQLEPHLNAARA